MSLLARSRLRVLGGAGKKSTKYRFRLRKRRLEVPHSPAGPQMRAYRLAGGVGTLQGWFSRGRKMIPLLSSLPVATAWAGPPPVHSQWPLLFPARISSK